MHFPWILAILLITALSASGCSNIPPVTPATGSGLVAREEISYDVFIPETGVASPFGESSKAALSIAMEDINQYYNDTGSPTRLLLIYHDTRTDPATSLSLIRKVHNRGGRFILGYITSAELQAMKNETDVSGMIIISSGSTAPALAIPGDSIFRVVSDDSEQGHAMASYLAGENITAIVPLWRGDLWGDELKNATEQAFEAKGGTTTRGVRYLPGDPDRNASVIALDVLTGKAIGKYGAGRTGVYAVTFNEIDGFMDLAMKAPNLSQVRWFGSDGNAGIPQLTGTGTASRFATATNFTGIIWGAPGFSPEDAAVLDRITKRLGREPDGQAVALYDTLWVLSGVAGDTRNATNRDQLMHALTHHFNTYTGISEDMAINEAGDRVLASYHIVRLGPGINGSEWSLLGVVPV